MHALRGMPEGAPIRAVNICRLLTIILREYRESGPLRARRFSPAEHFFEDI